MNIKISSLNYCPVKSLSFQKINKCKIKKNIGIEGDRNFAFSQNLNLDEVKLFEKNPNERKDKWNKILTLKSSPVLNKYNFIFKDSELTLFLKDNKILTIDVNQPTECQMLSDKITELEKSLKQPLVLIRNENFPFFDTSISKKINF